MRDYINIGATPADEPCAQVGEPNYQERAREECKRFIALLRKRFGNEPSGAQLKIKSFPHDFGSYLEVVCFYDPQLPESVDYAFRCEGETPLTWDETDFHPEIW